MLPVDEFTDLNLDNYNGESEIIGCGRCTLMLSFIGDKPSSFFGELTNKIKYFEMKLRGLNVFASSVSRQHSEFNNESHLDIIYEYPTNTFRYVIIGIIRLHGEYSFQA